MSPMHRAPLRFIRIILIKRMIPAFIIRKAIKEHQERDIYREVQTQCMAVGDGIDYEKYEQNPVLDQRDIPEGSSCISLKLPFSSS